MRRFSAKIANIYFIKPVGLDGPIKIGFSEVPEWRLASLTVWSPWPLEIIGTVQGTFEDEQFLHNCFFDHHSHREWFRSSAELRAAIAAVIETGSVAIIRSTMTPKGSIRSVKSKRRDPAKKQFRSYNARLWWARKKMWDLPERKSGAWSVPDDIDRIMSRWQGSSYRHVDGIEPTSAELQRLDQFLSDPLTHGRHMPEPAGAAQ